MSLAGHRTAIAAKLAAVPNVGLVHDEEPYARSEAGYRALYAWAPSPGMDKQIRGWWLRRVRTIERTVGLGRGLNVHHWMLRGFMALDTDAGSGKAFDDIVEAVRLAFRTDPSLGGATDPGPLDQNNGVQVNDSGPVVLAGALCHGAQLALVTYEYLDEGE